MDEERQNSGVVCGGPRREQGQAFIQLVGPLADRIGLLEDALYYTLVSSCKCWTRGLRQDA